MYKISREKKIIEQLELEGSEVLEINIDVEKTSKEFNTAYNEVIKAEKRMNELKLMADSEKPIGIDIEKDYGTAIISLFEVIFGKENTDKILKYYENRYIEMSAEVFPFIIQVIFPRMQEYTQEKTEKLRNNYLAAKGSGKKKSVLQKSRR